MISTWRMKKNTCLLYTSDVDTWMFFKWIFKTFCAVLIVTNTWNIVMGIFDVGQSVVNSSAGVIIGNTSIDISSVITDMEAQLEALGTGELFGLWFQSLFVGLTMNALSICIMLVIYGRMIEVYLTTSVGPIPLATMTNRDWSHTGQNYLKSLFALAFQAFLIMVCVGIYSVLVQSIATDGNISGAIWACMGYTCLLYTSKEKNSGYNDYRAKREEYRRLQTVKGNIDQILRRSEPQRRKEQSHER